MGVWDTVIKIFLKKKINTFFNINLYYNFISPGDNLAQLIPKRVRVNYKLFRNTYHLVFFLKNYYYYYLNLFLKVEALEGLRVLQVSWLV